MGLENSSELFTISVNGVLYLQVCGAVPSMHEAWGCVGRWSGPLGTAPLDTLKCWCWLEKSQASGPILPPALAPQPVLRDNGLTFRPSKNLIM